MRNAKEELRAALHSVVSMTVEPAKQTLALTRISASVDRYIIQDDEIRGEEHNERLLEHYVQQLSLAGKSEKTIRMYRYAVRGFMTYIAKDLRRATSKDIREYLASIKTKGVSNSYVDTRRAWLSSFYTWLEATDEIVKSPMKAIAPIKVEKEIKQPFSAVEIDKLRAACRTSKERATIEVLLSSGVRVNEFVHLKQEDLNWSTLSLHVKEGKGGKERITYLSEIAAMHLRNYLRFAKSEYMFSWRGQMLRTEAIRNMLHRIAERAGVEDVHPHRFRRTFATSLVDRGMPVNELKPLMGHSNIDTTMTYVYQSEKKLESSYKRYAG